MDRVVCSVLIGREIVLTELEDALLAANRGDGQIVLLAGEAGVGKSRLASEVERRARKIGMTVLSGGCSEADLALPYLPFLEALGNYLTTVDLEQVRKEPASLRREQHKRLTQPRHKRAMYGRRGHVVTPLHRDGRHVL